MNGKIRVSIVATALHGSEAKPYLNLVNNSSSLAGSFNNLGAINRNSNTESLFNNNQLEKNVVSSIDGATALKLDENLELKNSEEQSNLIDSFTNEEESQITENNIPLNNDMSEVPSGVSIESASYVENNIQIKPEKTTIEDNLVKDSIHEEYTPKLFSEEQSSNEIDHSTEKDERETEQLFDQDNNEDEDFEIPAFLRRQKF